MRKNSKRNSTGETAVRRKKKGVKKNKKTENQKKEPTVLVRGGEKQGGERSMKMSGGGNNFSILEKGSPIERGKDLGGGRTFFVGRKNNQEQGAKEPGGNSRLQPCSCGRDVKDKGRWRGKGGEGRPSEKLLRDLIYAIAGGWGKKTGGNGVDIDSPGVSESNVPRC